MEAQIQADKEWRGDGDFELGKKEILAYWRTILRCYGMDEGRLSYQWESAPTRGTWSLCTSDATARHELAFAAEDVRGWSSQPQLLRKYLPEIRSVLDRLLNQDPESLR